MIYFNQFFKLPGPKDLGMSDNNYAMGTDFFPQEGVPTWEEYYARIQKEYPCRFFFASTLPNFFRYGWVRFTRPITDCIYWLQSNTYRKYHMLDLRQPCGKDQLSNIDCYRYGWRDVPDKMLYAMFNLLGEYLNEECPNDLTQWHTLEEINADEGMKMEQDSINEAKVIYQWWSVGRKEERAEYYKVLHLWSKAKKNKLSEENDLWQQMSDLDDAGELKTDEMIARLIKIRRTLWT
jgi:hypothetical protein